MTNLPPEIKGGTFVRSKAFLMGCFAEARPSLGVPQRRLEVKQTALCFLKILDTLYVARRQRFCPLSRDHRALTLSRVCEAGEFTWWFGFDLLAWRSSIDIRL
jgi:hypothetical protein